MPRRLGRRVTARRQDADDARAENDGEDFSPRRDRGGSSGQGKHPRNAVAFERLAAQTPARANDERDDGRTDAVEDGVKKRHAGPSNVGRGNRDHNPERRSCKRDSHDQRARRAGTREAAVDRQLVRKRPRTGGSERQAEIEVSRCEPRPRFDQIAAHAFCERGRATEARRAERQEVESERREWRAALIHRNRQDRWRARHWPPPRARTRRAPRRRPESPIRSSRRR